MRRMDMKREELRKLRQWQDRLETAKEAIQPELDRMGKRESIYDGDPTIYRPDGAKAEAGRASHVRNVAFELVEAQVESDIPTPKVTAIRQEDEHLADVVENLLRNVIDKLPLSGSTMRGSASAPCRAATDCWWTGRTASAARTGWATCG